MQIIGISGLGADQRVFKFLDLTSDIKVLEWIDPLPNESLANYSLRLSAQIETDGPIIIIAVSFGGLIANELSKILPVEHVVLVSSIEIAKELSLWFRIIGSLNIIRFLPEFLFKPPFWLMQLFFVAAVSNRPLLKDILEDTDRKFAKWATHVMLTWKNKSRMEDVLRIHGNKDRLIAFPKELPSVMIENGHHFMIVDQASEIRKIIHENLKKYSIFNELY